MTDRVYIQSASSAQQAADAERFAQTNPNQSNVAPTIRFGNGGGRVVFRNGVGEYEDTSLRQSTTAEAARVNEKARGAAVLSTARSRLGTPVAPSDVRADTVVTLPGGVEARAQDAERAGFLVRDPATGAYRDPFDAPAGANAKPSQDTDEGSKDNEAAADPAIAEAVALPNETDEAVLGRMLESSSPSDQVAVVEAIIGGETIPDGIIEQLASRMGASETEAVAAMAHVHAQMTAQADGVAAEFGIEPEELWGWAQEHRADQFKTAMRRHASERTLTGYVALRNEYLTDLDRHDPETCKESLEASGIAYRVQRGRIVIQTLAGEMAWPQAVKTGALKLSRNS